jgi:tight adherence protein B
VDGVNVLSVVVSGVGVGVGLLLVVGAFAGWPMLPCRTALAAFAGRCQQLIAVGGAAVLVGLVVWLVTGWPMAGLMAAGAAAVAPRLVGGGKARQEAIERTEAVATWTESVRDTMAAAAGLEEAIAATAVAPPAPIADEVRRLSHRLAHQRLPDALVGFADDLAHPSADLVVAALTIAARMEAADLGGVLSRLAVSIRDDATMRVKVESGRAKLRTSARIIVGAVAATVAMLMLLSRSYLDAYDSATGQLMLLVVAAVFAAGGLLMVRMSHIALPERFVPRGGGS